MVGVQLIPRVLNVFVGAAGSVVFSLWVWAFHGLTWLKYRRRKAAAPGAARG